MDGPFLHMSLTNYCDSFDSESTEIILVLKLIGTNSTGILTVVI